MASCPLEDRTLYYTINLIKENNKEKNKEFFLENNSVHFTDHKQEGNPIGRVLLTEVKLQDRSLMPAALQHIQKLVTKRNRLA